MLTVWRAEMGPIPLGTYLAPAEARAHAADHHEMDYGPTALAWYPEYSDDEDGPLLLHAAEQPTAYRVVPVEVRAAYDPLAER